MMSMVFTGVGFDAQMVSIVSFPPIIDVGCRFFNFSKMRKVFVFEFFFGRSPGLEGVCLRPRWRIAVRGQGR